jgi:hypothetical protein
MFTYLLTGVVFWVLWHWRAAAEDGPLRRGPSSVWVLPVVMVLWVNLHIGFVFGFLVLVAFGVEAQIKRQYNQLKKLTVVGIACVIAALINPFGYKLLLYPLNIFKNYGYLIVENQSIKFLENINFGNGLHFSLFKIIAGAVIVSFIAVAIKNWRKVDVAFLILTLASGYLAYSAIRNFPSFAFFALAALALNIYLFWPKQIHIAYQAALSVVFFVIVIISFRQQYLEFLAIRPVLGWGLLPAVQSSVEFFKANKIGGSVFNNYDIGGYLIFNLYPQMVFVDNRPEAYSVDFLQNVYIQAQQNQEVWKKLDEKYNFNSIFFAWHDYTPWAQTFLVSKVKDPAWAPVYVDSYGLIFLKRNEQNEQLIKQFELPRSLFIGANKQ